MSSSTIAIICVCSIVGAGVIAALIYFSVKKCKSKNDKYEILAEEHLWYDIVSLFKYYLYNFYM